MPIYSLAFLEPARKTDFSLLSHNLSGLFCNFRYIKSYVEHTNKIMKFVYLYWMLFLAHLSHLSRRLIGELIVYPWSGVLLSTFSNISSETAWPIKAKFYVEPSWVVGTKVCSGHLGHMTKMAATPIYGKNPSKIFSRTGGPIFTKHGM